MSEFHRIDYICDHCNVGLAIYNGSWFENQQTKERLYFHRCEVCGTQVALSKAYPLTDFQTEVPQ